MSSGDGRLDTLTRLTCGRALSLHPLPMEMDWVDGASESESVVAAFTEQFAVDVSEVGANQRKQLLSVLGDNVFRTVVMIFVADFVPRVWAGLDALGLGKPGNGGAVEWDHETDPIDALLNGFIPAVARLRASGSRHDRGGPVAGGGAAQLPAVQVTARDPCAGCRRDRGPLRPDRAVRVRRRFDRRAEGGVALRGCADLVAVSDRCRRWLRECTSTSPRTRRWS